MPTYKISGLTTASAVSATNLIEISQDGTSRSATLNQIAALVSVAAISAVAIGPIVSSGLTMATARLLGRSSVGTGPIQEIALGTGLAMTSAGVLSATGSGTVTSLNITTGSTGLTATGGPVTTSGTISIGGTLAVANGGTGANSATSARSALGLAIGTNVQAFSSTLSLLGAKTSAPAGEIVGTSDAQTLTNKSLPFATIVSASIVGPTITGGTVSSAYLTNAQIPAYRKPMSLTSPGPSGSINVDVLTGSVYYMVSGTSPFSVVLRANASTQLVSALGIGESVTTQVIVQGNSNGLSYVTTVVPDVFNTTNTAWLNGTAPTSGSTTGRDVYTFQVVKLSTNAVFQIFAKQERYA